MSERISHHGQGCAVYIIPETMEHPGEMCRDADGKPIERRVAKAEQREVDHGCKFDRREYEGKAANHPGRCPVNERQRQRRGASQGFRCVSCKSEFASPPEKCSQCGCRGFAVFPLVAPPSSVDRQASIVRIARHEEALGDYDKFVPPASSVESPKTTEWDMEIPRDNRFHPWFPAPSSVESAAPKPGDVELDRDLATLHDMRHPASSPVSKLVEALRKCEEFFNRQCGWDKARAMQAMCEEALKPYSLDGNAKGEV